MAQEDDKKVKLKSTSTTTHGDRMTVTEREPETTTRTERKVSGFINPDGTRNEAAQAEFEQGAQRIAAANHIDPNTGRVDKRYLSDIFGFDPNETKKKREDEEALNRRKAKEAAWANAVSTLGDMIGAAHGGNVWKKDMLKHSQQASEENKALWREQQQEDATLAGKTNAIEQSYADQVQKLHDAISKAYGTTVSSSQKTGGKTTSKTTQGKDVTIATREEQQRGLYGSGSRAYAGAGGKNDPKIIKVQLKDGSSADIRMPAGEYDATGRYLSALYNALDKAGNDNISKVLSDSGIEPQETGKGKYTYDGADLLSSGIVFDNPKIREEFVKAINADESLTMAERARILSEMQTYPTIAPKEIKKSWWQRFLDLFKKDEQPTSGKWKPGSSNNEATSDLVD